MPEDEVVTRAFPAKYPTVCGVCQGPIPVGMMIVKVRLDGTEEWVHAAHYVDVER